jgi:hAT family C-terminal dimerisation region
MNSWSVLQKYYNLTDKNHGIYACATLLNPGLRKRHFTDNWTGEMADFIPVMEATCWDTYKAEYLPLAKPKVPEPTKKFTFRYSIYGTKATDDEDGSLTYDEFQRFIYATPTTVAKNDTHWNPIKWWIDESKKGNFDTLHLYALDHLSCPAMATQCERVFSAARRTLTPERNALGMKVIEACECLRWWWRNGVVSGMPTVCPMAPRAVVEAQFVAVLVGDSALSGASEESVD